MASSWLYDSAVMLWPVFRKLCSELFHLLPTRHWPWPFLVKDLALGNAQATHQCPTIDHLFAYYRKISIFHHTWWCALKNGSFRWRNSRDDATLNLRFCWFSVKRWGTHLSSFFFIPINLRCIETEVGGMLYGFPVFSYDTSLGSYVNM